MISDQQYDAYPQLSACLTLQFHQRPHRTHCPISLEFQGPVPDQSPRRTHPLLRLFSLVGSLRLLILASLKILRAVERVFGMIVCLILLALIVLTNSQDQKDFLCSRETQKKSSLLLFSTTRTPSEFLATFAIFS